MSLAPTAYGALTGEDPAAVGSQAIDLQSLSGVGSASASGEQPSDDMLLREIRDILHNADLMKVSKKTVRAELERRFGVNLDSRKAYIGSATQAVMNGQL